MIGTVHLLQSRVDEAIAWLEKARSDIPAASIVRGHLASAYALKGETERAPAGGGTRAIARMKVVSRDVVSGVSGRLRPTSAVTHAQGRHLVTDGVDHSEFAQIVADRTTPMRKSFQAVTTFQ